MLAAALVGRDMGLFKLTTHCGGGGGLKAGFEAIALRIAVLSRDSSSVGSGSSDGGSDAGSGGDPRPNQLSARSWRQAMIRSLFAFDLFSVRRHLSFSLELSCFFLTLCYCRDCAKSIYP